MTERFNLKADQWIHEPDRKREYNKALFDEVAPKYDFVTQVLSLGRDKAWKRNLIAQLHDGDQLACLDLACGTGDITMALATKYPNGDIVGLDICESMLRVARERSANDQIHFQVGDMGATGLESKSIDVITGGYALRNAPSIDGVLDEVARLLRPGGTAAFLDFSKPSGQFFQGIQHTVLMTWGGFWGLVLHRNPAVYAYIARSLKQFPDRNTLHEMIRQRGFVELRSQRFYFGTLDLLVFKAPE